MHEHSIFYGLVNPWFKDLFGFEVPDHILNGIFVLILLTIFSLILKRYILKMGVEKPSRIQSMVEVVVKGLMDMMDDIIGHKAGEKFLPIVGAFAFFIFFCNISGLFFFLNPATSNPNTTFALSLTAFFLYHIQGISKHKAGYIKQFLGPMLAMAIIIFPVEVISHSVRALSLGLRLYGNMFGEHTISGFISNMAPIFAPLPMMALGLIAATMQTFIFVVLFMVYVGGALAEEH